MNTNSIAFQNLETGEVFDTKLKIPDNRFPVKGYKLYKNSMTKLIDKLTKDELKRSLELFDASTSDFNNVLTLPFHKLTADMSKSARSRFRKNLQEANAMGIYNKRIMLNPYLFLPRIDKNVKNSQYMTQQMWKYMFEDMSNPSVEVIELTKRVFGSILPDSKYIKVGTGNSETIIESPVTLGNS